MRPSLLITLALAALVSANPIEDPAKRDFFEGITSLFGAATSKVVGVYSQVSENVHGGPIHPVTEYGSVEASNIALAASSAYSAASTATGSVNAQATTAAISAQSVASLAAQSRVSMSSASAIATGGTGAPSAGSPVTDRSASLLFSAGAVGMAIVAGGVLVL